MYSLSFTGFFFKQYRIKNIWPPPGIEPRTACLCLKQAVLYLISGGDQTIIYYYYYYLFIYYYYYYLDEDNSTDTSGAAAGAFLSFSAMFAAILTLGIVG